jgi:hypothetical protein
VFRAGAEEEMDSCFPPVGSGFMGEGASLFQILRFSPLKVPKCEIFHRSDFPDFYTIKSSLVGDLVIKILTYYFNF